MAGQARPAAKKTAKKAAAKKSPKKAAKKPENGAPVIGKVRPNPPEKKAKKEPAENAHPNAGLTFFELTRMSAKELTPIFENGVTPKFDELLCWEFRGFNPPVFARIFGFQKFKKGFFVDKDQSADGTAISGYNVLVRQNWLDDPHVAKPNEETPKRHGFYVVSAVNPGAKDNKHPHALLLNYGIGRNWQYNPERVIRDYLVRVDPGNPDLFLGKAYLAIGPLRVFSNYFVLDRYNKSNFDPATIG